KVSHGEAQQPRQKKAVKIFPRPTAGPLRPVVHGQTLKYNMKVRAGRGFSLEELKAAGIPKKLAPTIGISAGDSAPEELANATQVQGEFLPIAREKPAFELVKITDDMKSFKAYNKLRLERTNARHLAMVKHNNVIPNGHFKKHWQNYVKTWFNQPARKTRRRIVKFVFILKLSPARQKKAVKIFPRPTAGPLRPVVHGQTLKYNMKVRAGRGFSLEELKAAGIPKKLAPTIGISVDHRRRNRSLEGLQSNVQRLKTYKAKLVVFPRRARKFKAGDSAPEELANATQVQGEFLPIAREKPAFELVKITDDMKSFKAYNKLRLERTNARHLGARLKRAAEAEKEDKK
ncbi:hypothetical protein F8388_020753, partial [Cannabis sativa]